MLKKMIVLVLLLTGTKAFAQEENNGGDRWYDKIHFGGYMQVRYNKLLETNPNLGCEQCDEYWGGAGGGLSLRRVRFKFYGQISPRVFMYIQPDLSKSVGESIHVARIKDAYLDVGLDADNEFRVRIGQSKVPFGFENMQSSSTRLPLDRNDAINSGVKDERDVGVFLYWASKEKRTLMKELKSYKHSGDFGVFALGFYNGQTANHPDLNNEFHLVSRFSYPIEIGNQVVEPGIQAYSGKYVITEHSPEIKVNTDGYLDQRAALSFLLYPKPFGIQAEYNVGRGPEYDHASNSIKVKHLEGGYATLSYMVNRGETLFTPFVRFQYYDGGKKHELDARSYTVKDTEIGIEWSPFDHFELVAEYAISDRRYEDYELQDNHQTGSLMRFQAQLKF
ncbi:porin [Cyclobacterium marinum]|uniref:porin n=1 Tax=Cyclobacterium marinum TaxID=104 RepID=UPI0030DC9EF5|tara:strand:- start:920 stop:2095 length:1176 start_codon:yes stop_codon:yes gene_type:complete